MYSSDTIAAIATAVAPSGIAIIRLSGEGAIEAADRIFKSPVEKKSLLNAKTHTLHYGNIVKNKGCSDEVTVDEVLVSVMRGPKSYTGEDVAEINCHGGITAVRKVYELVLESGVRPADPGEFTKRAFLNGRIDLSQAEAVADVINSQNTFALKAAVGRLGGSLQKKISDTRKKILNELAYIEAALDDPEHYSLEGYVEEIKKKTEVMISDIEKIIRNYEKGRILCDGIRTAIVGKPNAGKSSVLNMFMGEDRAIVTDIPGTTRDVLTENVKLGDISLIITDTAGIRDTNDAIEKIGIERAKRAAEEADLVIFVADGSKPFEAEDLDILNIVSGKKCIALVNKSDLKQCLDINFFKKNMPVVHICAKEGSGLEEIEKLVKDLFDAGELSQNDEVIITSERQIELIKHAKESLGMVLNAIEAGMPEDMLAIDLKDACDYLGLITGENVRDDLVDEIFSKFCMGK